MSITANAATQQILSRASWRDVLRGRATIVGSRFDPGARRGVFSPVEARVHMGIPYGDLASEERAYLSRRSLRRDAGVIARTIVTAAFAPSGRGRKEDRPFVVSARVDNLSIDAALDRLLTARAQRDRARMVHFVHPHALNLAARDGALASHLADADEVLPDGVGIRVAAAVLGIAIRHNINGTDLLPLLCRRAANEQVPMVFVGSAPGVADECATRVRASVSGLSIPIVSHGFLDDDQTRALVSQTRELGRCIVLVGMGSPVQERWAWQHLASLREATVVTVGGLFDFYSGHRPRAPMAMRELGLEWAFRMLQEPRRLGSRYLVGNPMFIARAILQRAAASSASRTRTRR